jgi:hypothetical protein
MLTGPLSIPRKDVESFLSKHGIRIINKLPVYRFYFDKYILITNNLHSTSSKMNNAICSNISIMTEREFVAFLRRDKIFDWPGNPPNVIREQTGTYWYREDDIEI